MSKQSFVFLCSLLAALFVAPALAYKEQTHENISEEAVTTSVLKMNSDLLPKLGLAPFLNNQIFPNADGVRQTIVRLFRTGASFEDSGARARNHFFNPINSQPLSINGVVLGHASPDWALEDRSEITGTLGFGAQAFSYRDARQYFYKALTSSPKAEREKNFGLTFQTLGQVIHHVQDMAQPQLGEIV